MMNRAMTGASPPTSVTGDTHLCFGHLRCCLPQKHPPDPHSSTFPSQPRGKMNPMEQINP